MKRTVITIPIINESKPNDSRLTAIEFADWVIQPNGNRVRMVNCKCVCGKDIVTQAAAIINGHSKSCGCYHTDGIKRRLTKFAHYPWALRMVYQCMISRCYKPKSNGYKSYGAKGVTVCDEWINDRELFFKWALANGWEKGMHVDKDKIGNGLLYSPDTCCILTPVENSQHKSKGNVRLFKYKGKVRGLKEISKMVGMRHSFLSERIYQYKDSLSQAIKRGRIIQKHGKYFLHTKSKKEVPIIQLTLDGKFIKEWESLKYTEKYGFNRSVISECCRKLRGRTKHQNFRWMYKSEYITLELNETN